MSSLPFPVLLVFSPFVCVLAAPVDRIFVVFFPVVIPPVLAAGTLLWLPKLPPAGPFAKILISCYLESPAAPSWEYAAIGLSY